MSQGKLQIKHGNEGFVRLLDPYLKKHIDLLTVRYPKLEMIRQSVTEAYFLMEECYKNDGKLLIAGNPCPVGIMA